MSGVVWIVNQSKAFNQQTMRVTALLAIGFFELLYVGLDGTWVYLKQLSSLLVATFSAVDQRCVALLEVDHRPVGIEKVLVEAALLRLHRLRNIFLPDENISDALLKLSNVARPRVVRRYLIF